MWRKKKTFEKRKINDVFSKPSLKYRNNFSQIELETCWNDYHSIKVKNKEFNIASLLKMSKPKKVNNEIIYSVISDINKKELEEELPKLINYIRISLKNDLIQINVDSKNFIRKNTIYTASEKFEKLVELNPSLEKLRNKLDLDF